MQILTLLSLVLLVMTAVTVTGCDSNAPSPTKMTLHTVTSSRSLSDLSARVEAEAKKLKFGVIATHDLPATMKKKGVDFDGEVLVLEVCSPTHAKQVLEQDISISVALPCRISIYRKGNESVLATMPPAQMLQMFGYPELKPVAQEVQDALYAIMKAAAAE